MRTKLCIAVHWESKSETGAKKFLVLERMARFNQVETTMALDGRATLASSAHFNGSTHRNTKKQNALFSSGKLHGTTIQCYSSLKCTAHLNASFNTTQQSAESSAIS